MGLQVRCPLCGWTRPPVDYGGFDLGAKDVRSLGGNRGFEHVEVEMPPDLQQEIEVAIAGVYHRYVDHDPFEVAGDEAAQAVDDRLERRPERPERSDRDREMPDVEAIEEDIAEVVEEAVEEVDADSSDPDRPRIDAAIGKAVKEATIRREVARVVEEVDADSPDLDRSRIDEAIGKAAEKAAIRREVARAAEEGEEEIGSME